ncbi:hypothetical protein LCGC14_1156170 [marine sediment metagenome]|uniref:Uncharacterized protein n=1 Tax=marine sediment metagenome TaxID=412755 RepID=A0A0F9LYW5_9ZZZZ
MIIIVPITGELTSYDSKTKQGVGNDKNPIRPIDFNKILPEGCDFRWDAVSYDYEGGMTIVEITFAKKVTITELDNSKDPPEPLAWRRENDAEFYKRQANTERIILAALDGKKADELYKITGEAKLIMP